MGAHLALLLAMITAAREPATTMTFLHPAVAGTVLLVTLGWITGSILGALYVVGPLGLRLRIAVGRLDYIALVLYLLGASGLVTHFWIAEFSGMAGSAIAVWVAVVLVLGRFWNAMRVTSLEPGVRLFLTLACVNFAVAGGMGVLLGLNRVWPLLGGATVGVLYGHAHLAAIGWAMMLALGVGCRVLPMVIPARPPKGPRLVVTACLIEAGLVVLVPSLVTPQRLDAAGRGADFSRPDVVRRRSRAHGETPAAAESRDSRAVRRAAPRRFRDGVSRRRDRPRPHARMEAFRTRCAAGGLDLRHPRTAGIPGPADCGRAGTDVAALRLVLGVAAPRPDSPAADAVHASRPGAASRCPPRSGSPEWSHWSWEHSTAGQSVFAFGAVLIAAAVSVGLASLLVTTTVAFLRERRKVRSAAA